MVFSDKTKINCFNANRRFWCWGNDKESISDCVVKHGGGFVMLELYDIKRSR